MEELKLKVNKKQTLKDALSSYGFSRNYLSKLKGKIFVNNNSEYFSFFCNKGDEIKIICQDEESSSFLPQNQDLNILFEDNYLLIVNKPSGIPTITSKGHQINTLSNYVLSHLLKKSANVVVRPVNRLDSPTRGIVVFAKNALVQSLFDSKKYKIKKYYKAKVFGKTKICGTIKQNIAKDENEFAFYKIDKNGKCAVTKYLRTHYDKKADISSLKIRLLTGRTHQIRVHFSYFNHAVVGDTWYGKNRSQKPPQKIELCAYKIIFVHPITHKKMKITID